MTLAPSARRGCWPDGAVCNPQSSSGPVSPWQFGRVALRYVFRGGHRQVSSAQRDDPGPSAIHMVKYVSPDLPLQRRMPPLSSSWTPRCVCHAEPVCWRMLGHLRQLSPGSILSPSAAGSPSNHSRLWATISGHCTVVVGRFAMSERTQPVPLHARLTVVLRTR